MAFTGFLRLQSVAWRTLGSSRRLPVGPRWSPTVRNNYTARDRYGGLGFAAAPREATAPPKAVGSRQRLLEEVPYEIHRVVGVTFEGRQQLVAQLRRGQAVAFVKEPDNEYDPNAVMVQTLDGETLGYMPRDMTQRFLQDVCFGYVYSMGQTEEGLYGFRVAVQPTMPPVQVLAFPSVLAPYVNLAQMLSGPAWEAVRQSILRRAGNRCEVTGAWNTSEVHEKWQFDDSLQVMRLSGFQALAQEVSQVQHMLQLPQGSKQQLEATQLLALLNDWNPQDAEAYLGHMRQLQQQRSQPGWKLDLSSLRQYNLQVPAAIAPMRIAAT